MLERRVELNKSFDLRHTLGPLQHGKLDPCVQLEPGRFWQAARTPEGSATLLLQLEANTLIARAWGAGAQWCVDNVCQLIGEGCQDLETDHPVVAPLVHRFQGMRVPRTGNVFESCLPVILEQRVTTREAFRSYRQIVRKYGEPAPGPAGQNGLMLPPTAATVAAIPYYALHPFGVDKKRADALKAVARYATRMQEASNMTPEAAHARLKAVPGVGVWTAAEVAYRALGDGDAVSVGDYNYKNWVSWALAGEPRGDDDRMLELLEPFAGHRGKVIRLIGAGGIRPPKWGPKYNPLPIASF